MGREELFAVQPRWRTPLAVAVAVLFVGNAAAYASIDRPSPPDNEASGDNAIADAVAPVLPPPESGPAPNPASNPASTMPPPSAAEPTASKGAPSQNPATPAFLDQFPVMSEGFRFDVELTPVCARPGETFTAVVRLKPKWGSAASLMPFYSDGSYDDGTAAVAGPDGTVHYAWAARPVSGEGRLVIRAQDADRHEQGLTVKAFRVAEVGASC